MSFGNTASTERVSYDMTPPQNEWCQTAPTDLFHTFDSSISSFANGRRCFRLHVRGFCSLHPPGNTTIPDQNSAGEPVQRTVEILAITPDEVQAFQRGATRDIETVWNGKLFLEAMDISRGYAHLRHPVPPPLECRIELEWVDTPQQAHLHVQLLKAVSVGTGRRSSDPRSNCKFGGANWFQDLWAQLGGNAGEVDMVMHLHQAGGYQWNHAHLGPGTCAGPQYPRSVADTTSDPVEPMQPTTVRCQRCQTPAVVLTQTVFAHEFGHYLGLRHVCAGVGHAPNSSGEYGDRQGLDKIQDIMGAGDVVTARVATPWEQQLHRHGYFPQYTWRGTTEAPSSERRVRTVRTRTAGGS